MSDYLSPDAWIEILTRLPLKNILQCTLVCKSWYSLITSANFINTHLNLSIAKRETRLLIRDSVEKAEENQPGKEHYSVYWDNDTFDEYAKFNFPYSSVLSENLWIIGNCNGLVCLSDDIRGSIRTMYLWNPSIRKFVTIPYPNITYMSHGSYVNSYGFGYVAETSDYKIVRVVNLEKGDTYIFPPVIELFELSTGSWRRISVREFPYIILHCSQQTFLNGVVHFFGYDPNQGGDLLIVTFDMRNEALGAMMVPLCVQLETGWDMHFGVYGELLSFSHKPWNEDCCNIWVMKEYGVAKSWTKHFTIYLNRLNLWRPFYFRENGDILLVKKSGFGCLGDGRDGGDLLSYDPKSKQIKNVDGKEAVSYVGTYVESLVLLEGLNGVLGRHGNFGDAVTSEGASLLPTEKDEDKVN